MSQRDKNNSIIFLTTLSVYLGLVLVGGATSSVLAQAALTRNFDVQEEIEVRDDLDNKPDDEEARNLPNGDLPAVFAQLLNEIKEEVKNGKISLPLQADFIIDVQYRASKMCSGTSIGSNISDQNLSDFVGNAVNRKFESKIYEITDYGSGKSEKGGRVRLEANSTDLTLEISFTKSNAEQFADFLNQEFSLSTVSVENTLTKQIYENTTATSENNQVFIVTRLPRGSLDELLKQDGKAESK
ncbi:MAG: hypothetical protein M3367_05275 [Acidobacteriota bacterium]|nr:hypothetical protein [Acidobacteriota bacterium]